MGPLARFLRRRSELFLIVSGLILVAALGVLNSGIGAEAAFSLFYWVPIALVTWFASRRAGLIVALASAAAWLAADLCSGRVYAHPAIRYWNVAAGWISFLGLALILSALKVAWARQMELTRTDTLTGAANVRHFYEFAQVETDRARRYRHPVTIAYIDIDDFQALNERFGRSTGDAILRTTAQAIQESVRTSDLVARLGSDEFGIIFTEIAPDSVETVIMRLHENLLRAVRDRGWEVTFSIGVVTFAQPSTTIDEMMRTVSEVMEQIRGSGKNAVKREVFDL